jgi:hypothetical protein
VAFRTLQSLDRNVKPAALLLKLLDDVVNVHAGMLAFDMLTLCFHTGQEKGAVPSRPLATAIRARSVPTNPQKLFSSRC